MLRELILFLFAYWVMIIAHELGHWWVLKLLGSEYKFTKSFGYFGFQYKLSKDKEVAEFFIFWIAIVAGFIPLFVFAQFISMTTVNILIGLYMLGCLWDLDQILKILKGVK